MISCCLGGYSIFFQIASAHILMTSPTPRTGTTDSTKTTTTGGSSCGGVVRGDSVLTVNKGSQLSVSWKETIDHPGRFLIQFSPSADEGFDATSNELFRLEDTQVKGTYTAQITLPDTTCTDCSLRLVQVMDDQVGQIYVNCVNLQLINSNSSTNPGSNEPGASNSNSSNQSTSSLSKAPMPSGCLMAAGTIDTHQNSNTFTYPTFIYLLLLQIPFVYWCFLRIRKDDKIC